MKVRFRDGQKEFTRFEAEPILDVDVGDLQERPLTALRIEVVRPNGTFARCWLTLGLDGKGRLRAQLRAQGRPDQADRQAHVSAPWQSPARINGPSGAATIS